MKTLSIKNLTSSVAILCFVALFFVSCSSDEDPIVLFTSLEANKPDAFIEETIILNLAGTGYTDVNVTCSAPSVKITKVTSTIYEITSSASATANVFVTLSNKTNKESKSVALNFYEHGIKDFKVIEGIRVNLDKTPKILDLLGEPFQKSTSTSGLIEYWSYPTKGISIAITKNSGLVNSINILSSNYYITLENGTKLYYTNYPYEIGNGWKINNASTAMDAVIAKLGAPSEKISSTDPTSTLRTYRYTSQNMYVSFYGANVDDYTGKLIKSLILY